MNKLCVCVHLFLFIFYFLCAVYRSFEPYNMEDLREHHNACHRKWNNNNNKSIKYTKSSFWDEVHPKYMRWLCIYRANTHTPNTHTHMYTEKNEKIFILCTHFILFLKNKYIDNIGTVLFPKSTMFFMCEAQKIPSSSWTYNLTLHTYTHTNAHRILILNIRRFSIVAGWIDIDSLRLASCFFCLS